VRTIHTEIGIGAPAAKVWDILAAIDKWPEWNPFASVSGLTALFCTRNLLDSGDCCAIWMAIDG